jgi:hypothetical protein
VADDKLPHLTVQERPAKQLAARLEGVLAVDEATNCIVVVKSHVVEPAWPPGCSVAVRDGSLVVLDGAGHTIAEVGATVVLGGGFMSPERAHTTSHTGRKGVFAVGGGMLVRRGNRGE